MKARLLSLVILTGVLSAASVFAQDEAKADAQAPADDKSGQLEKRRQEMLARFDTNGDGVLDDQEKAVMRATLKKERDEKQAAKVSGSGDIGSLSAGAPGSAAPGVDRFVLEIIKRFDKDGDGKLDATELAAFLKSRMTPGASAQGAAIRAQMMKMFDKNGDGVLDAEERAEMEKFRDEQIKRFDKNGDGVLDAEERTEAMKAFMADHPEPAPAGK